MLREGGKLRNGPEYSAQYFIVANYLSPHLERFLPFKRTIYQFP